jgi:hypothetical protein
MSQSSANNLKGILLQFKLNCNREEKNFFGDFERFIFKEKKSSFNLLFFSADWALKTTPGAARF